MSQPPLKVFRIQRAQQFHPSQVQRVEQIQRDLRLNRTRIFQIRPKVLVKGLTTGSFSVNASLNLM